MMESKYKYSTRHLKSSRDICAPIAKFRTLYKVKNTWRRKGHQYEHLYLPSEKVASFSNRVNKWKVCHLSKWCLPETRAYLSGHVISHSPH